MLTAERHQAILHLLAEQGRVTVADIARRFAISTATARRDAVLLSEAGMAVRSHGGLLPAHFFRDAPDLSAKLARPTGPKARIARRTVDLVPHEGNVFVDAGSTCLEAGRLLIERPDLCIFTNSIPLIALVSQSRASLTGLGGESKKGETALTGPLTQAWLADLRFDLAIIGASGLDAAKGAFAHDPRQAAVKREALDRASVRVLVADTDKWRHPAGVHFARWDKISALVSDDNLPDGARAALRAENVKVYLA